MAWVCKENKEGLIGENINGSDLRCEVERKSMNIGMDGQCEVNVGWKRYVCGPKKNVCT